MNTRFVLLPLVLCTVLWSGCDRNGNPLIPFSPPVGTVTSVAVTPDRRIAFVGEVVQFEATVNVQGTVADRTVTWTSTDTTVATVDANGRATTIGPGLTSILARSKADTAVLGGASLTVVVFTPATFSINATKITDTGCNFSPSFTGQLQASGNSDGTNLTIRMIERLTRIYAGALKADGTFTTAGSGNLDGYQYSGTIIGQATANTVQGTETMNFTTGCPGRQVVYQFVGNR